MFDVEDLDGREARLCGVAAHGFGSHDRARAGTAVLHAHAQAVQGAERVERNRSISPAGAAKVSSDRSSATSTAPSTPARMSGAGWGAGKPDRTQHAVDGRPHQLVAEPCVLTGGFPYLGVAQPA